MAGLTRKQVAEKPGMLVDVVCKLEQHRKHSAPLPTLHALAKGLGTEVTALLGDPPAIASTSAQAARLRGESAAVCPRSASRRSR